MTTRRSERWLGAAAAALAVAGACLLAASYPAHARMVEYLRIGDASAAEIPEIEMWACALSGAAALFASGALAAFAFGVRRHSPAD